MAHSFPGKCNLGQNKVLFFSKGEFSINKGNLLLKIVVLESIAKYVTFYDPCRNGNPQKKSVWASNNVKGDYHGIFL